MPATQQKKSGALKLAVTFTAILAVTYVVAAGAWNRFFAGIPSSPTAECPHSFVDSAGNFRQIALVGALTNVPEFHDCQRFITDRWSWLPMIGPQYMGSFAIYIRNFAELAFRPTTIADTAGIGAGPALTGGVLGPDQPTAALGGSAITMAVIYSYTDSYPQLGIAPGFNCLYLHKTGTRAYGAIMVPVGFSGDSTCARTVPPDSLDGTALGVTVSQPYNVQLPAAYPAVARWHWDHEAMLQYIGIGCFDAWCMIGPSDLTPDPEPLGSLVANMAAQFKVPGWGDDQWIAVKQGSRLKPSLVRGWIFPHPDLGTYSEPDFDTPVSGTEWPWLPVAFMALESDVSGYRSKMNTGAASIPDGMTIVYICKGTRQKCGFEAPNLPDAGWWARFVAPGTATVVYRAVELKDYPAGILPPGTVRWRWNLRDEMGWVRCPLGCCEMLPD